jgi:hypothetical protein
MGMLIKSGLEWYQRGVERGTDIGRLEELFTDCRLVVISSMPVS